MRRYVFCCSNSHNVAPKGKYIAFVSAEVETENPEAELEAGLALLGPIDEKIIDMYDMYEPVNDCTLDNCYISKVSHGAWMDICWKFERWL
jgi:Rab GDP dissociation inhibitor